MLAAQAAIPRMHGRAGAITCVSSIAALRGHQRTAYAAAKAGVIGLVITLAEQLGPRGIRVNAIAPGQVWTPMVAYQGAEGREARRRRTPLGTEGTAWDVAWAAVYLASDERSEEHTSELQSPCNLVCRLLLEKKKISRRSNTHVQLLHRTKDYPGHVNV